MKALIKAFVYISVLLAGTRVWAQSDTLYVSPAQAEGLFLKQNLQLIAEKLNIDKAEAAICQAKLWPNPTLTIDQVNLWATDAQRQGADEVIPPLAGNFGKNLEFGAGIDQLIQMGGKRRKLVNMEKISKEIAIQYFEELLCSLKTELRSACAELAYAQQYSRVLKEQQAKLFLLIANYQEQAKRGHVSQSQQLRLQAALVEVESELSDLWKEINLQQKNLKTLLCLSGPFYICLAEEEGTFQSPETFSFGWLSEQAATSRPDLKRAVLQTDFYRKSIRYEKAQRVPDITLHASYDRGGNCMLNFVGFGFSIDLPFFNRNQGAIKAAEFGYKQSMAEVEYGQITVSNEVMQALDNYRTSYNLHARINNELTANLEQFQDSYTRNFLEKNIGVVEFLDFLDTYKENKRAVLAARKEVCKSFEELQYAVGTELTKTN